MVFIHNVHSCYVCDKGSQLQGKNRRPAQFPVVDIKNGIWQPRHYFIVCVGETNPFMYYLTFPDSNSNNNNNIFVDARHDKSSATKPTTTPF